MCRHSFSAADKITDKLVYRWLTSPLNSNISNSRELAIPPVERSIWCRSGTLVASEPYLGYPAFNCVHTDSAALFAVLWRQESPKYRPAHSHQERCSVAALSHAMALAGPSSARSHSRNHPQTSLAMCTSKPLCTPKCSDPRD